MKRLLVLSLCMLLFFPVISISGNIQNNINRHTSLNDGTLSGYVNDTYMNPIEGALVRVYFHGTYEEDYTDSSGYYHVTNIPICYCMKNCTASKSGYKSEWVLLAIVEDTTYDFTLSNGNILYVGGSGPGNYTFIQEAINNSSDGDTIFVYEDSSPYNENVVVDKSIKLIGENKNTTIINGNNEQYTVILLADGVYITGFQIQHEISGKPLYYLYIFSDGNSILNNIIICEQGRLESGIKLLNSSNNLISRNIIRDYYSEGIELRNSHYNEISKNIITGYKRRRGIGINLIDSSYNIINNNEISKTTDCVCLHELINITSNNLINQNNFLRYYLRMSGAYFTYDYHRFKGNRGNIFFENYWNRPRFVPKYILGWVGLFEIGEYNYLVRVPKPKFDLHPAQEPFDI
jgi:parallel beta-helix repeat protein